MTHTTNPAGTAAAEGLEHLTPDDWHSDLDALAEGLVELHRQPFHTVTPARFRDLVGSLHGRIDHLSATGVLVGLDEVTAAIGDGHTQLETDRYYRRLPLEVFWYGDQVRVVNAAAEHGDLLGARLLAVDGVAVEDVHRRLQRLVPQSENAWYERQRGAELLTRADVLVACGVLRAAGTARLTLAGRDGTSVDAGLDALPAGTAPSWPRPAAGGPLRSRGRDEVLPHTALAGSDTTYANLRRYDGLGQAADRLIAHLRDTQAQRLILDLRDNAGGDYTLARHLLIYPIWGLPAINRPGGLYVLIGRRTFSAAMVTATDFRRETEAVLVGEPTGARPTGYQENGTFDLPRSGIRAHCAIRHYRFSDAGVTAVLPDQHVEPDWEADRQEHDNAIAWCLGQPV